MLIVYKLESIKREIEIHSRNAIIHVLMSLEYPWASLCLQVYYLAFFGFWD